MAEKYTWNNLIDNTVYRVYANSIEESRQKLVVYLYILNGYFIYRDMLDWNTMYNMGYIYDYA